MRVVILAKLLGLMLHASCSQRSDFKSGNGQRAVVSETEVFIQDNYPTRNLELVTGDERLAAIEQFDQKAIPLDILVVIDNSGSMAQEQNGLADKLKPLLSEVKPVHPR